jgi:hypothetical protein
MRRPGYDRKEAAMKFRDMDDLLKGFGPLLARLPERSMIEGSRGPALMKRRTIAAAAAMLIGSAAGVSSGDAVAADNLLPANAGAQGTAATYEAVTPAGTDEFACFSYGAGAAMTRVCVSRNGNITSFEAPAGREHIRQGVILEGYALCSNGGSIVHGWDAAFLASAWGRTITTAGPIVTRTTSDGIFKIVQTYAFNGPEGEMKITMKITNLSGVRRNNVVLSRYFDGDVDETTSEFGSITSASVFEWRPKPGHGLKLTSLTFKTPHDPYVETFPPDYSECTPATSHTLAGPDDLAGRLNYSLGNIGPGATKTVVFGYERI